MDDIKIRMLCNVRPEILFLAKPGTILRYDEEYPAKANKNGAISGLCQNGEYMGVKPGEFEFVAAPGWILDIWKGRKEAKLLEYQSKLFKMPTKW